MPETVQHFPENDWPPQEDWYFLEDESYYPRGIEWLFPYSTAGPWLYPAYLPNVDHTAPPPILRCEMCIHHEGECKCALNIFIAAEGVDMGECWGFEEGRTCRHCGKRT